jgi:hypothetical protein
MKISFIFLCIETNNNFNTTNNCRIYTIDYSSVTTLALGSRPRQELANVQGESEAQESHFMLPGVYEGVREQTPMLPSGLPPWELEFQWTPESS